MPESHFKLTLPKYGNGAGNGAGCGDNAGDATDDVYEGTSGDVPSGVLGVMRFTLTYIYIYSKACASVLTSVRNTVEININRYILGLLKQWLIKHIHQRHGMDVCTY